MQVYSSIKLIDLNGISIRFEFRLNTNGINSPWIFSGQNEFFTKKCFSKYHWILLVSPSSRWEVDDFEIRAQSFGQRIFLKEKTEDREKLKTIIMKLCENGPTFGDSRIN